MILDSIEITKQNVDVWKLFLTNAVGLLDMYRDLIDTFVLDFFTEDIWSKLSPRCQDAFEGISPLHLANFLSPDAKLRQEKVWPLSVQALRAAAFTYSLPRKPITTDRSFMSYLDKQTHMSSKSSTPSSAESSNLVCSNSGKNDFKSYANHFSSPLQQKEVSWGSATSELSCEAGQHKLLQHVFRRHLKPKKQHEVARLAYIAGQVAHSVSEGVIIDVGSGQGHLSRFLAYGHDVRVVCLEAQDEFIKGAKKFDNQLELAVKKMKRKYESLPPLPPPPRHYTCHLEPNIKPAAFKEADLKKSEEQNNALQAELSALKEKIVSVEAEKTQIETSLSNEITRQKEDLGAVRFKLKNVLSEKEQEICELMEDLKVKKEESTASHEKLKSNENKISLLETQCNNQESELTKLKDKFSEVETELQASQNKNKSLQDSLQKERTNVELLGKSKLEMQSKLDTLTSEKNRLLQNLDEYVEKVSFAESSAKELEESHQKKCSEFLELEAKLQQVESDSEELRQQLKSSEEELQQKIESSDTVTLLRDATKALEDELSEKKQALKVQGQRLADMKKTIQREFKLSADTTDHVPESRSEFRPPQTTSPVPAAFSLPNNIQMGMMAMNGSGGGEEVVNNTYLKHVIIKYLTSREYEAVHLTRAVATLLHMTPEEERLLRETLEWKMSWFGSKPNLGKGQNALTIPPSQ